MSLIWSRGMPFRALKRPFWTCLWARSHHQIGNSFLIFRLSGVWLDQIWECFRWQCQHELRWFMTSARFQFILIEINAAIASRSPKRMLYRTAQTLHYTSIPNREASLYASSRNALRIPLLSLFEIWRWCKFLIWNWTLLESLSPPDTVLWCLIALLNEFVRIIFNPSASVQEKFRVCERVSRVASLLEN